MRKLLVVLVAAGALAAGAAAANIPRVAHTPAGMKAAEATLLKLSDLGSTWTAQEQTGTQTGVNFACTAFNPKQRDLVEIGTATSPNFKVSDIGPFLVQKTSIFKSSATARRLWQRALKPRLVDCVAQTLQALTSRGVKVTVTAKTTIAVGKLGDRSAGYRVVATLITSQRRLKTYFDVVILAAGPTVTQLTISQFQKAPALKWEQALAKIAARRIGAGVPTA
jgi:hypothetical protein